MKPIMRMYQDEDDYWHIRKFLREVSLLNDRHDYSWPLLRWDYWVWHVNMNIFHFKLEDAVHLWEVDGQIVAMVNPDSTGEAFFQVHPVYRGEGLLCEMLDAAEARLPNQTEAGRQELITWVNAEDSLHKGVLARRGYTRSKYKAEHMRWRFLTQPVPDSVPPAGYTVRALGDESELPARSGCRGRPFTRTSLMKSTKAGSGIKTSNAFHSTGVTSISSRWPGMESWPRSARSGLTM